MKFRLCLSILTAGLVMSLNGAASAQSVGRNSGVVDRPRPDYDPLGIRAGAFSFYPSILASETYNDNIFATNQNAESDFITVVQPEARLSSNWSRHSLSLVGFGRFSRFLQESNQNTDEWGGAMNGVLDLASWGNATGNALYQRAVQPRTDPENPGGEKPSLYDQTQVIGTYDRAFQRLLTRFEVELNQYDFLSAEDLLLDRTETAVSVRLGYQISPRLAAYVRPIYRTRSYDSPGAGGVTRDSKELAGLAGIDLEIAALLNLNISAGYYRTDFDDPSVNAGSGLALSGTATWFPTERLTVSGILSRATQATQQEGASSRVNTLFSARADYELFPDVLVGARANYSRDEYDGVDRVDDTIGGGLNIRWLLNRRASAFADIGALHRTSNQRINSFDQNLFTVGIRFQL
jgi:hypothetical protein